MTHNCIEILYKLAIIILCMCILNPGSSFNIENKRIKRSFPLLFTNKSTTTFICGFGIPVPNFNPELVTMGMVFKAQQFLPTTFQDFKQLSSHNIERKSVTVDDGLNVLQKRDNTLSKYRIFFYKALEQLSTSLGQKGRICVLKMICEASTVPFHYKNGVLGELIYILLTPSSSLDTYATTQDYDYVKAEKIGKSGLSCENLFSDCKESILDRITNIFE